MASYLGLEKNISYYTVNSRSSRLSVAAESILRAHGPRQKVFDGNNPRLFTQALEKSDLDKRLKGRLQRAEAATANAFETLGFYAAAVTAGNAGGVSAETLNNLSLGYLVSRIFYTWIYIWGQENRKWILARTNVWGVSMGLTMAIFVLAGIRGNERGM